MSESVALQSWFFFFAIMFGYQVESLILVFIFYYRDANRYKKWKAQPSQSGGLLGGLWIHPLLSSKPQRAKYHKQITALNLFLASCFAGACSELAIRGHSTLSFEMIPLHGSNFESINSFYEIYLYITRLCVHGCTMGNFIHSTGLFIWQLTLAVVYQSVLEYYWHLMMHLPWFYRTFHKIHHTLKSPEVWDDLYIHPVEACGYYMILYSPAFVIPMNIISFLVYMAIMGVAGVM